MLGLGDRAGSGGKARALSPPRRPLRCRRRRSLRTCTGRSRGASRRLRDGGWRRRRKRRRRAISFPRPQWHSLSVGRVPGGSSTRGATSLSDVYTLPVFVSVSNLFCFIFVSVYSTIEAQRNG